MAVCAVLGIDAAWTNKHNSGVALVTLNSARWVCIALAPSYETFLDSQGDESQEILSKVADPAALLKSANQRLSTDCVRVVAVDMPLSNRTISGRRAADNLISQAFGKFGCSTHSPTTIRPGPISDCLRDGFAAQGFELHTACGGARPALSLIETFPHPALLALCQCDYRVPYKVSKARRYWPRVPQSEIFTNLKTQMQRILERLRKDIDQIPTHIELAFESSSLRELKALEDMIDALICAWVGIKYLNGDAEAYGDSCSAIWTPKNS